MEHESSAQARQAVESAVEPSGLDEEHDADQAAASRTSRALIESQFGAADVNAKRKRGFGEGTPADFATAEARHKANLNLLKSMLHEGRNQKDSKWGKSWPNACQWLLAGKTSLHALTETHDSAARASTLGDASSRALFGIDVTVPTMSTYDENDQTKADNIQLADPSWLGYRQAGSPSKVVIIDPVTKSKELVKETIVHEVQHDADHLGDSDFDGYQSEFAAYWIDKTYVHKPRKSGTADDLLTAADGTVLSGFDNARQQAIFRHLYDSASYSYVADGWTTDAAFKAKVLALTYPKGVNLVNSPRIDDLYLELSKTPPDVDEARKKVKKLSGHDRAAIVSPAMVESWRTVVAGLSADDQAFFKKALHL
jgi:hypothetical protein